MQPHPASPRTVGGGGGPSLSSILERNSVVTHSPFNDWLTSPTRDISTRFALLSSALLPSVLLSSEDPSRSSHAGSSNSSSTTATSQQHPHHHPHPHPHHHPPQSLSLSHKSFPYTPSFSLSSLSMARTTLHQPSLTSAYAPSLCFTTTTNGTPTESSISTGLASRLSGVPLLEEVDGVLEIRPNQLREPAFECSFWFLSCSYISRDREEWLVHCLSHFRGEEPPKSVSCPLCSDFSYTSSSGWESWSSRMEHLAQHHLQGQTLRTSRPDFHLFQHLWQKRLIDDQDLKELKGGNHNLTRPPENFIETNGRAVRTRGMGRRHQHIGAPRRVPL
ncbi:hypothetical protein GQ43DRAFT_437214 [Delitschia confertaspora ATCC 74209]|uniref:Uncharacterized protein n=1 Tax=Delitschia confertaspora ATCC 74209 TaxID=1513339 RepID=A0A9P4JXT9_9PLEO|nr:hypothetical protein GQ43DRAFT_437214 [Delitschia confertaspora ATCC 74209]